MPFQRLRPALPITTFMWSALPIAPIVARQADGNAANFAAGQRDLRPVGFAGHQRRAACRHCGTARRRGRAASRCCESPCPAESCVSGRQLPTVGGASGPLITVSPAFKPVGSEDVPLLAVDVVQQRDAGGAVRIVLNRIDLGRHAVLVAAEVDQPVLLLVAAAAMPGRDLALVVAAARLRLAAQQRLLGLRAWRQLGEVADGRPAAAGGGRIVFVECP